MINWKYVPETFKPSYIRRGEQVRYVGRKFVFVYPKEFATLDYSKHRGHKVKVVGRLSESETDALMYKIVCYDGWEGVAWPDELKAEGGSK